jgi:peptidoglycan L-alanyl-D-glutamate endopeptidase CwlK
MTFRFGKQSLENLQGVHPQIVAVVNLAITLSKQDFSVFEGMRSLERQRKLLASGASRTLDSYHLTGDAVDLVPYVDGRVQWQMPLCNEVARAVREAAVTLGVPMTWGRVWDRRLGDLHPENLEAARAAYVARYQRINGPERFPLDDGPHFQRVRQ